MFKFLKEKLKGAISKISEGVEKEGKAEEIIEKTVEEPKEESNASELLNGERVSSRASHATAKML